MGSIIGAGASIIGGNKAAKAQVKASSQEIQLARDALDQQQENIQPFLDGGRAALDAYNFELGIGPRPVAQSFEVTEVPGATTTTNGFATGQGQFIHTGRGEGAFSPGVATPQTTTGPTTFNANGQNFDTREAAQAFADDSQGFAYTGFKETPGYQFSLDEGNRALERSAAARGASQGGAFAKDLLRFNTGMANQEYGTHLNRLASQAGSGQVAVNSANAASGAFANQAGAATQRAGDARASSFANFGNAIGGAIRQEEQNSFQAAGIGASFFGGALGGF